LNLFENGCGGFHAISDGIVVVIGGKTRPGQTQE
jgi:hypothetical protein